MPSFGYSFQFYFNPLPRKEGDGFACSTISSKCSISIHSLVKRETFYFFRDPVFNGNFNPLPRKEGDDNPNGKG